MDPKEKDFGLQKLNTNKPETKKMSILLEKSTFLTQDYIMPNQRNSSIYQHKKSLNSNSNLFATEKIINNTYASDYGVKTIFEALDKMDYETLSQNFLKSDEVIAKTLKIKKFYSQSKIELRDTIKQIAKVFNFDSETKTRKFIEWSGQDVLQFEAKEENYGYYNNLISKLENLEIIIWQSKYIQY